MFNFTGLVAQTQLFHTRAVDELMAEAGLARTRAADLPAHAADAGLDQPDLAQLAPEDVLAQLRDDGIDHSVLQARPLFDRVHDLVGR